MRAKRTYGGPRECFTLNRGVADKWCSGVDLDYDTALLVGFSI